MTDTSPVRRRARRLLRLIVGLVVALVVASSPARPVAAHTDFESSSPADGDVVDGPLERIVVEFTNPAAPAGSGFELVDSTGAIRVPTSIDETDGTSFVLTFDPPIDSGSYGIRWEVRAGDAHPIAGSFRFDVGGARPNDTTGPSTTVASAPAAPGPMAEMDDAEHAAMSSSDALDALLAPTGDDAAPIGRAGRTVTMLGTIVGIGVLAALLWIIRGRTDELETQLGWVRLAGWVIAAGGLIELAALAEGDAADGTSALLATRPGVAAGLKIVGGLAVVIGFGTHAGRIVAPARSLSAAVVGAPVAGLRGDVGPDRASAGQRWSPSPTAVAGAVGFAVVLVSFWFDGHTVSKGPWVAHAAANLVHLVAAAVWGGGVLAMTSLAWMRHRRGRPTDLAAMVDRFSSIATASLVAVVAAGVVMAAMILDAPGDLVDTAWGRTLLVKLVAVAIAAGIGGYHHIRLRPALARDPDDSTLVSRARIGLSIESVMFVVIVVATAVLVAAAT